MKEILLCLTICCISLSAQARTRVLVVNKSPWLIKTSSVRLYPDNYSFLTVSDNGCLTLNMPGHEIQIKDVKLNKWYDFSDTTGEVTLFIDKKRVGTLHLTKFFSIEEVVTLFIEKDPLDDRALFYEFYDSTFAFGVLNGPHAVFSQNPENLKKDFASYIDQLG